MCLALLAAVVLPGVAAAQEDLLGEIRTIDQVKFEGRDRVSAGELKSVIKTRQSSMWPWREREVLRADFLRSDTLAIRDRYRHHGFLDAHVDSRVDPTRDSARVVVTFLIHEGPQSKVVSVGLTGVKNHPEEPLRNKLLAKPGRPFDPYVLQLDTLKISELYQDKGYRPHVIASARRGPDGDSLEVHVEYSVEEGSQYRVGEVYLHGNETVRENLIRRELELKKDDVYRRSRMVRSWEKLYDTGLLSQVQISPIVDSTRSRMDFDLLVRPRKRRWVDAGVGSGTSERFRATAEWGHRNLFGYGYQGALDSRVAVDAHWRFLLSRTEFSLLDPWFLGTRTRAVATPWFERSDDRQPGNWLIRSTSHGINFELLRELDRFSRITISQNNANVHQDLTLFSDTLSQSRLDSLEATVVEHYTTHSITMAGIRDRRDNPLNASHGSTQMMSLELAGGPLKGTSSFRKVSFNTAWYTPTRKGWVIATRFSAGFIQPTGEAVTFSPEDIGVDSAVASVPVGDRFRLGGVNSIRGYDENTIPFSGGLALLQANAELRIPIAGPVGLEVYVDAGNVWARPSYIKASDFALEKSDDPLTANEVRYVFGIGPRVNLPIGPLRLDFTWSLRPTPDQNGVPRWLVAKPQFAIGPSF